MATKTENNLNQSVYIADKDMVVNYPRTMSNDEINYDVQTRIREKPPEDYYINFMPLTSIQKGFNVLATGGGSLLTDVGIKEGEKFSKFEKETMQPALKLGVIRPDVAFGLSHEDITPEELEQTYKPWVDIWKESAIGQKSNKITDRFLSYAPAPVAFVPWFMTEFLPGELLEFGTKPVNWVGAYGVEKFGPPVLNAALSKLPEKARSVLLRDIFEGEKALAKDFETLGVQINAKTSEVVNAYKQGAKVTHPDAGGDPNEFVTLKTSYENIMRSRGGWADKLFDMFRSSSEFGARTARTTAEPRGLLMLSDESGSALIPFSKDDIVKVGSAFGKVVKVAGKIASVNIAGKITKFPITDLEAVSGLPSEDAATNIERLQISDEAKFKILEATTQLGAEIENVSGKKLTHEEVLEAAKTAEILSKGVSREATLQFEASLLNTRKHLAALAEQNELTPEFLDALRVVANTGTDIARSLESMKIEAMPEFATAKVKIIKDIMKLGVDSNKILEAAKGVDFKDEQAVAKFYRKFVKPKLGEKLDEFVYMNILSSPLTHIVNTTSNLIQLAALNPLTKLASGMVDMVAANMTGAERMHYVSSVPQFYKGALNAVPEAFKLAFNIMKGKKTLERPDVKHIPTLSKLVDWGTLKVGKYVPRALEASDVFFRTMIEAGETEAMTRKLGHEPSEKELLKIKEKAKKTAEYFVFRQKPDSDGGSGQGDFLSAVDNLTNAIYRLRSVPGVKWFVRFVQTPMNILKQGIEYSPAGFATLKGGKDKSEQIGKAIIGSMVFTGASYLAANNMLTWAAPTGKREKNEFYAAGLQPYSVRIGDKWVSYSKLGPLAYPLAMAAAFHYYTKESPTALSDSDMDKIVDSMTGFMRFFSDQSYLRGVGDLLGFMRGEKTKAFSSVPTQLVPLSSLQGWINQITDEFQRKPADGLSIESIVDNIQMKLAGMSQYVPAQIDYEEAPVKKQMRGINAVSPVKISKVNRGKLSEYKETQRMKQEINLEKSQLDK